MYSKQPVSVPDAPGKLVFHAKGKSVYVLFEIGRTYNPEKQYNVPMRKIIGKLVANKDRSTMFPNETYFEHFPLKNARKEEAKASPSPREGDGRSCCLQIGAQMAIQRTAAELGVTKILEERLGDEAGLALDIIGYLLLNEDNAGRSYSDFAFNHPLSTEGMEICSDSKVALFLNSMTRNQIAGILDDWNAHQDHKNRIYISCDFADRGRDAGDVDIIDVERPRDGNGLPAFNVSVAYDKTNRIPLFYEEYPECTSDISKLQFVADKAFGHSYQSIGFVFDRGYLSQASVEYMDKMGYSFLLAANGCKTLARPIVDGLRGSFESDRDCFIPRWRIYGRTVRRRLFPEDAKERYFHLYFSPSRTAAEREQVEAKLENLSASLKSMEGLGVEVGAPYTAYFDCVYDGKGRLLFAKEKKEAVQKELERCGYFCIVSSDNADAADAYRLYKGRDASEKLFRADRVFLGSHPTIEDSREATSAKLLLGFLALVIRNRICNLLKSEMIRTAQRHKFMSVPAALKELEKIEMHRTGAGRYKLDRAPTTTQQTILRAFGIGGKDVEEYADNLSAALEEAIIQPEEADFWEEDGELAEYFHAPEID